MDVLDRANNDVTLEYPVLMCQIWVPSLALSSVGAALVDNLKSNIYSRCKQNE